MRFSRSPTDDGGQAALADGSGGVCDYRPVYVCIHTTYTKAAAAAAATYAGAGGGGSHGPQCAFSDGPGRAQETDREHALPVHNGPVAAVQEYTGDERIRRRK